MLSRNAQLHGAELASFVNDVETRHSVGVKVYVACGIIAALGYAEGDDVRKSLGRVAYIDIGVIGNDHAVFRNELGELLE